MIFVLLIIYQIKHLLADYPLQTKYMLGKFKGGFGWILPLLAHVSVHGIMTFIIAFVATLFIIDMRSETLLAVAYEPSLYLIGLFAVKLALFDMTAHFIMDRIKASPNLLGRFQPFTKKEYEQGVTQAQIKSNVFFWWSLGLDQMVHHLTHYVIIWKLLS